MNADNTVNVYSVVELFQNLFLRLIDLVSVWGWTFPERSMTEKLCSVDSSVCLPRPAFSKVAALPSPIVLKIQHSH